MPAFKYLVSQSDPPAKRAILLQSLDLFAGRGVDGVTVRDIAARTGYSNPALFKHFRSKDELALSLFELCYAQLADGFTRAAANGQPLRELLRECLALIEEAPDVVHYVLENLRRFFPLLPAAQRRRYILGSTRQILAAEQEQGRVRADADIDLAAAALLGTLGQLAHMAYFDELGCGPSTLAEPLWQQLVDGIGAAQPGRAAKERRR